MNFDLLERDLDVQDETIAYCAEALRRRARGIGALALMGAADWLESEDGICAILDLMLGETTERRSVDSKGGGRG